MIYKSDIFRGTKDGLMMGLDPVGTLYSTLAKHYSTTFGGRGLQNNAKQDIATYRISKTIGTLVGLEVNLLLAIFPQSYLFIRNIYQMWHSRKNRSI